LSWVRETRNKAWHKCVADAIAQANPGQAVAESQVSGLVEQLHKRVQEVWELRWANRWKEVWWRLLLHGVRGAGGHGWPWAQGKTCVCRWQPPVGTDAYTRAFHQRAHVFWGCPCAQAVVQCLREYIPQVFLLPVHLWLLIPPSPYVAAHDWVVLGLAALSAMLSLRGVFASSGTDGVCVKTRALLDFALQDFSSSQF
jgi:hypothetical protein